MEIVKDIALYLFSFCFVCGFLTTVLTGTARILKYTLAILTGVFIIASIAGFFFTRGWLIFLYTQLLVLWLVVYFVILAGAAAGAGVYLLFHRRQIGQALQTTELGEYLPISEFAALEGISEERTLGRIRSRYYRGGSCQGRWYVHKAELSASFTQ